MAKTNRVLVQKLGFVSIARAIGSSQTRFGPELLQQL